MSKLHMYLCTYACIGKPFVRWAPCREKPSQRLLARPRPRRGQFLSVIPYWEVLRWCDSGYCYVVTCSTFWRKCNSLVCAVSQNTCWVSQTFAYDWELSQHVHMRLIRRRAAATLELAQISSTIVCRMGFVIFFWFLLVQVLADAAIWLLFWGKKRSRRLMFAGSMHATSITPPSVGGMRLLLFSSPKWVLVAALVALAGALPLAAVSAVLLPTAVVVHMAAPQGVASVSPVKTMKLSISAPTSAQLTTLHALF